MYLVLTFLLSYFEKIAHVSGVSVCISVALWPSLRCSRPHPRRPRGSQSGREKRQDESCQVRAKKPLGTDPHRTISKN